MRMLHFTRLAILCIGCVLQACDSATSKEADPSSLSSIQMVQRGEYLVAAIGCDDCHSPKRMTSKGPEVIPELRLSGHPASQPLAPVDTAVLKNGWMLFGPEFTSAVGPWGVSFAANISSDATGIGNWNDSNFIAAMRTGKIKGLKNGRPILPPMPWPNFGKLTDDDLKSILAYLKTTKPVRNLVPPPLPPANM